MPSSTELTPLVLVVADQEWASKAVEGILRPKGHVVLKAHTGQQALDLASKVSPDAILVDVGLPDMDGIDLVRRLKTASTVHETTPILVTSEEVLGKAQRLDALGAGAWDILVHPIDSNELILRMDTFVRAKQQADRVREEGLTDPATGFYNVRGVLKRAHELNADAVRFGRPLTCIAFGPQSVAGDGPASERPSSEAESMSLPVATALKSVTRISDTVGKLGPGEFVVVAPGTDPEGAVRLADRVIEALRASGNDETIPDPMLGLIRAGFCSLEASEETSAEDLLLRATMALRRAQAEDESFRVRSYEA